MNPVSHWLFDLIYVLGGLILLIGLIGMRSKIPRAIFCWRLAASLCIAFGIMGLVTNLTPDRFPHVHYLLLYWGHCLQNIDLGMLLTLLLVCRKFESSKGVSQP
jgi:hypothetical protein